MAKLLLHICCAPCSIGVVGIRNRELVNNITGFFYNPNIHPQEEYKRRKDCLVEYAQQNNLPVIWGEYEPRKYFEEVFSGYQISNIKKAPPRKSLRDKKNINKIYQLVENGRLYFPKEIRCPVCYRLRLEKTAHCAKEKRFDYFTTTLLSSPYQNLQKIKEIGEEVAEKYRVKFYFEDFTCGFKKSQQKAKELNLYRQKYCGCIFSMKNSK
jgi:predicted adenine nucleotide alpha hydrolase (AANH) superfamily ATPase